MQIQAYAGTTLRASADGGVRCISVDRDGTLVMVSRDVFALSKSEFNPFLFAGVGTELNGMDLTILSLLARLGSDPWAEASRLAALPKAAAADWLADRIAQTPLTAQPLGEARTTAERLLLLLPSPESRRKSKVGVTVDKTKVPLWAVVALVVCAPVIGIAANARGSAPEAATGQTIQDSR